MPRGRNPYILLVEDNDDDASITLRALKEHNMGNSIVTLKDGAEALDFLTRQGDYTGREGSLPQLILLDINLPKLNGLELLKAIRERKETRLVPVVMLTTSDQERDVIEAYNHRVNSYIRKPVRFEDFVTAIAQLGGYWLLLNQLPWTLET